MPSESEKIDFVFFGSSKFSVYVLEVLKKNGFVARLIVTTPDKPYGRKMIIRPTPVKEWATSNGIDVYSPAKFDQAFLEDLRARTKDSGLFIVASYGKIIPESILAMPKSGTLNVHPSLLPAYRGASPLQSTIIDDAKDTGVSIMLIDKEMDHGPIIARKPVHIEKWPVYEEFERIMAEAGGQLLSESLSPWLHGKIKAQGQDHSSATYTKKIKKEDGLIELTDDPYTNFRKIQAYHGWPWAHFFISHNGSKIRVKITSASFEGDKLSIEKVIPEGGKEMSYSDFVRGYTVPSREN